MTEDKMVGQHDQRDGHEFEQALGVGDGQGGLACCSPWGCKESHTTERLNRNDIFFYLIFFFKVLIYIFSQPTFLGEGNGNPLQYSCLENPMDRGSWRAIVHGVAKSRTQLSD